MKRAYAFSLAVMTAGLLVAVLAASGSVSCGGRMMYRSTVEVGTTNPQTAFYAAIMAVNKYRYPFEQVDAGAGVIRTAQIGAGKGRWYAFHIQVQPTGAVLVDPVTNMEKATGSGVLVPRSVVSRANNIARLISKTVSSKSEQQIALEGEMLHQQILGGMAVAGSAAPAAVPVAPGTAVTAPEEGVAVPAGG